MSSAKRLACCLIALPFVGTLPPVSPTRTLSLDAARQRTATRAPLLAMLRQATDLYAAARYTDALNGFEAMRQASIRAGVPDLAARALGNVGGCQFALHNYPAALASFSETVRQANAAGDSSAAAVFDANIASLYSEMGELDAAAQWMEGVLARMSDLDRRDQFPKIAIQLATFRARQGRMAEAIPLFEQGIDAADRADNLELAAIGWNRLGEEYLKQGDLARAEQPLLHAFRIRELHHLALDSSYRSLGRLRLEQGDLEAASALLDRAVELASGPRGAIPTWDIYHYRGRERLAQGRLREALDDLRVALRLAREWRWSAPPEDALRVGAEGWLARVHSAFVEAGNRLYLETHDPALIRETFEAAEENRASSLREMVRSRRSSVVSAFPPEWWEALAKLQQAEVRALRENSPAAEVSVAAARADLVRLQIAIGPAAAPPPAALVESTRQSMTDGDVLLSFHLGESASWLWALDRDELALYRLPARHEIEEQVKAAVLATRGDSANNPDAPARLWQTLFGELAPRFQRKARWLAALDEGLFDAPLAALEDHSQEAPVRLAERHVVEVIPGAGYWIEAGSRRPVRRAPLFVGLGDAIYNTADPRFDKRSGAARRTDANLALPRLVGSGAEVEDCARAWRGDRVLLTGCDASAAKLRAQLERGPAVVHIAAHVLESREQPVYGMIALSLTPQRQNELISPDEIAGWRTSVGLVVLSGCHSGGGGALPGTGLVGLTRAWLIAGAGAVIASNWDTPDESGALFRALYRHLSERPEASPAEAMHAAQLDMIHSGDWHANPRYWGAYFTVGAQ